MIEERILASLKGVVSTAPTTADDIADRLDIHISRVNLALDNLYEGKAIGQATRVKLGVSARLIWPTGLPYRKAIPHAPKPTTTNRTEKKEASTPSPNNDMTWQHLRTPPKQEPNMQTESKNELIVPKNANEAGIKTAQKILRLLFANTKASSPQVRKACNIAVIDSFIKPYLRKGYLSRHLDDNKIAIYQITPTGRLHGSADALYAVGSQKSPNNNLAKPIIDTKASVVEPVSETIKALGNIIEDMPINHAAEQLNEGEIKVHLNNDTYIDKPAAIEAAKPIRFAFTSDHTLMILGIDYSPIELSKADTDNLFDFVVATAGIHA